MRLALLHLRTSFTRWAVLPLAVLGVVIIFQRNTFWIGIWPEAGAVVVASAFFLSLFAAGLSAWACARTDAFRVREQTAATVRRPALLEALRFSASLVWLLLAYAVVVTAAAVVTAREGAPGLDFYAGYTLLGLFLVVMAAAWGWAVGRVMGPAFAAATAFFSWFIFISLIGPPTQANPVSGPPWVTIELGVVTLRLVVLAIFCLAVCMLPAKAVAQKHRQGLAAVAVMLALVVTTMLNTTVLAPRAPVAAPLCIDRTITYCLWPEHQKYVSLVEEVDARVATLPLDLDLPTRIVDYSLSSSTVWGEDGIEREVAGTFDPEFDISEGSRWALAQGVASAITSSVFATCKVDDPIDPESGIEQVYAWLEYRLAGGGAQDYTTDAPDELQSAWAKGQQVARELDDAEQAIWVAEVIRSTTTTYCSAS
ncbi:hypothetical protein [Sanguibacter antarcticus]|uniref:ABC-type transport system involved in multi-copper enzyme maturation permease subunit n=1 Tax=Sanguibacter antarcticus TaxID=372484 RepID=A0A2A9E1E2_9MICO|nr:hypothetical protein [Sanguibacter antarcticus]PFG32391.1 hypothetical protein ATL42_0221 [Sanguibacter antarcticus]